MGTTATGVAAARALASRRPDPLISDPYARPLVEALGMDYYVKMADGESGEAEGIDWHAVADGMAVRTRFFDEFFAGAAAAGVRQGVILACGLDTRAYRLSWPAGTTVFEIDQPDVVGFKTRTLSELGVRPDATVVPIGIDLRQDWSKALCDNGFDTSRPTAWIAEGLLGYLPPEAQDKLFDDVTALSAPGSRLATEWHPDLSVSTTERAAEVARAERERSGGLDIQSAEDMIYLGERNDVERYLGGLGWTVATESFAARAEALNVGYCDDDSVAGLFAARMTTAVLG